MFLRSLAFVAFALLLAACASPGGAAASARDLHVDLTLASGDRVQGSAADGDIALVTNTGRDVIPLSRVRSIASNADAETVSVRLADGEVRRCVIDAQSFVVLPQGASKPLRVPSSDVLAMRVTPRLRIAGSGDAWWDVTCVNALGFDVENADGRLCVRHIDPAAVNKGNHGPWSKVLLARDVAPRADFEFAADISWSAGGAGPRAMQCVYFTLLGADGSEIVCAGHHDAWDGTTGSRFSRLDGVSRESGYGTQPADGRAELRIVRTGGLITVRWNGEPMRCGEAGAPLARIVVQMDFYAWRGPGSESVFGAASVDRLEIR